MFLIDNIFEGNPAANVLEFSGNEAPEQRSTGLVSLSDGVIGTAGDLVSLSGGLVNTSGIASDSGENAGGCKAALTGGRNTGNGHTESTKKVWVVVVEEAEEGDEVFA